MNPEREKDLIHKTEFFDKGMKISLVCFFATLTIMLIVVIFQLFAIQSQIAGSIESNQKAGADNHKRTQQYVKCIANVLMKPLASRSTDDFNRCGLEGTDKTSRETQDDDQDTIASIQENPASEPTQIPRTPVAPTTQAPEQPVVTPPTTSAPPTPPTQSQQQATETPQPTLLQTLDSRIVQPLLSPLKNLIGGF